MSICSLVCSLCLSLVNGAVAAPLIFTGFKQGFLTNSDIKAQTNTSDWNLERQNKEGNSTDSHTGLDEADKWSVIWYLGIFCCLVIFFLVVTFSEWCFGNHLYTRHGVNEFYFNAYQNNINGIQQRVSDTPPPAYDLFAPPSYAELFDSVPETKKKSEVNIFIIPVHRRPSRGPAN